jgi:hypothetical protein
MTEFKIEFLPVRDLIIIKKSTNVPESILEIKSL